jgi:hypothetical protein
MNIRRAPWLLLWIAVGPGCGVAEFQGSADAGNDASSDSTNPTDAPLMVDSPAADAAANVDAPPADSRVADAKPLLDVGISDVKPPSDIQPLSTFVDDFERPDGEVLGNGWIEKTASAFRLANGHVTSTSTSTASADLLCYRTFAEAANSVNVEISMQFRTAVSIGSSNLMIFARGRSGAIVGANSYDGYQLTLSLSGTRMRISREGANPATIIDYPLMSPVNTTALYRMNLSVQGANPVVLRGTVERQAGTGWVTLGMANVTDVAPEQLTGAGTVGFTASGPDRFAVAEFSRLIFP